jgi:hypothetical protein
MNAAAAPADVSAAKLASGPEPQMQATWSADLLETAIRPDPERNSTGAHLGVGAGVALEAS